MSIRKIIVAAVLAGGSFMFFAGCEKDPEASQVPWSRPADWEGQVPGFGGR